MMNTTIKEVALVAVTTMAIAIVALSSFTFTTYQDSNDIHDDLEKVVNKTILLPSKRINRFLVESNNTYDHHGRGLKPADHCNKDEEVCDSRYGENFHCCGNKCFNFSIDKKHCGSCKNKCKFTYDCCDGKCVDKAYDKSHCGRCNNKCLKGQYCVYGMCDYA